MHKREFMKGFIGSFIAIPALSRSVAAEAREKTIDWNDRVLAWRNVPQGLGEMRQLKRPGLLIVYADWCPVCHKYAQLFKHPEVATALSRVVLIRVDQDRERELAAQYAVDGNYVPRTFALSSAGQPIPGLHDAEEYLHFLPPDDPEYLLEFVDKIISRERPRKS